LDNSTNESGFRVERARAGGAFAAVATLPPGRVAFVDAGLAPNAAYQYRVQAFNPSGRSAFAGPAEGLTLPVQPVETEAALVAGAIRLSWKDTSFPHAAARVERSKDRGATFTPVAILPPITDPAGIGTWLDTSLVPGRTYQYRVQATNAAGGSPFSTSNEVVVPAPAPAPNPPGNLVAVPLSPTSFGLTWEDRSSDETAFVVERRGRDGLWTRIVRLGAGTVAYLDSGVVAETDYDYRVRAQNAVGLSDPSNIASVTTPANPPGSPLDLTAVVVSDTRIDLLWKPAGRGETAYQIERQGPSSA
jgi:titin